jgi:hypothetical protein
MTQDQKQTLTDLATHVEGLDGPCPETDAKTFAEVNDMRLELRGDDLIGITHDYELSLGFFTYPQHKKTFTAFRCVPHYTSSVDAALTLKPEGCILLCAMECIDGEHSVDLGKSHTTDLWEAKAKTLPLAIVAACLRARAEEE